MPILLKDQTSDQLHVSLAPARVSLHLARRLLAAAVKRGELPAPGSGLTARLRDELRVLTAIPHLTLVRKTVSPQHGFAKFLFQGRGAGQFEAVRIPLMHRANDLKYVACISSQVGCAMGCAFCATGRTGFGRNLAAWEMVDQVVKLQADSPHPIRGVVFMGMGEPLKTHSCATAQADWTKVWSGRARLALGCAAPARGWWAQRHLLADLLTAAGCSSSRRRHRTRAPMLR